MKICTVALILTTFKNALLVCFHNPGTLDATFQLIIVSVPFRIHEALEDSWDPGRRMGPRITYDAVQQMRHFYLSLAANNFVSLQPIQPSSLHSHCLS